MKKINIIFSLALLVVNIGVVFAKPNLSELEAVTSETDKIKLFAFSDDLNQDFNNVTTASPEIRLVLRTKGGKKKKYKFNVYEVNGEQRTLLSTTDSKKTRNTMPLGSFEDISQKSLEIEVVAKNGKTNVYRTNVLMANSPSSSIVETTENQTEASLYTQCFTGENLANYEECLELFLGECLSSKMITQQSLPMKMATF